MRKFKYPEGANIDVQDYVTRADKDMFSSETILWRNVLLRVFKDADLDFTEIKSRKRCRQAWVAYRDAHNTRASALLWLRGNSKDFHEVCDLAAVNPNAIKDVALSLFGADVHHLNLPIDVYDARDILNEKEKRT